MKWIFRSFVATLLAGSMVLNGLQYVGSSLLTGAHNLIEGLTGIPSAMTTHGRAQAKTDKLHKKRLAKAKVVRQRANGRLARLVGRSGTRLGAEAIPIPPIAIAIETGLIASDFHDYCEAIDDIDEISILLGAKEVGPKSKYCGLDVSELASVLILSDEYSEAKEIKNETSVLKKYGELIHMQIEGWKNILYQ
jgi:hypothetical protein